MGTAGKTAVVLALAAAIAVVIVLKAKNAKLDGQVATAAPGGMTGTAEATAAPGVESTSTVAAALPRLVDFGSTTCIPCKMMAPILEELKAGYKGRLNVAFVDVGKDPNAWQPLNISTIPTQIFFDAGGKELYRHEGFIAKQDILAKWKELGFDLEKGASSAETR
jgi:thioredoxin-like negative regulator of GroEL